MIDLNEFLEKYIEQDLYQIIISGPRKKDGISKIKIRPVMLKEQLRFQVSETLGQKELHRNYRKEEVITYIERQMEHDFRQLQMEGARGKGSVLVSKKGKITIQEKKSPDGACRKEVNLEHNRRKQYLLEEGRPVPFLIDLGVMNQEGKILKPKYDKFKQLNRFLEFIEDILPRLERGRELTVLDFGCGKSYLTFAMYHYLRELKGYDVRIIGLDLKEDVIETCSRLAARYGYEKLQFLQGDIASYEGVEQVDMVVTLHACDTATDYALAKAVAWDASVILSVPCCQHELNGQISNELLEPVFSYGILKERFAAILTDGLRAKMLESQGYDTQILEFIDMEHTPKNLLIRAVKSQRPREYKKEYRECMEFFHARPTLERLLSAGEETEDEKGIN
jgi:SAM-dependent methyltransferase